MLGIIQISKLMVYVNAVILLYNLYIIIKRILFQIYFDEKIFFSHWNHFSSTLRYHAHNLTECPRSSPAMQTSQ